MTSRFDYVKYDVRAQKDQALLKVVFQDIESIIDATLEPGKHKNAALHALEEAYMWCGKDLRDQQIRRNGMAPLQEDRDPAAVLCNCESGPGMGFTHRPECAVTIAHESKR